MLKFVAICSFVAVASAGLLPSPHGVAVASPHAAIIEEHAPAQYDFSYSVHDTHTGDIKEQQESRHGDTVQGQYSLIEPDGNRRTVHYSADDHNGFNAVVQREASIHPQQVAHAPVAVAHAAPALTIANHGAPLALAQHATYAQAAPLALARHTTYTQAAPLALAQHATYAQAAPLALAQHATYAQAAPLALAQHATYAQAAPLATIAHAPLSHGYSHSTISHGLAPAGHIGLAQPVASLGLAGHALASHGVHGLNAAHGLHY